MDFKFFMYIVYGFQVQTLRTVKIGRGTKSTNGTGSGLWRGRGPKNTSGTGAATNGATKGAEAGARGFLLIPDILLVWVLTLRMVCGADRENVELAEKSPPGVVLQVNRNGKVGV